MRGLTTAAAMLAAMIPAMAVARPSARLAYSRTAGAASCPDERAIRAAVALRIGYDPFFPWVKQTVVASMAPAGKRGFVARVHLIDERGFEYGARELRAEGACDELLESAALVIAIAIDPQAIGRPAPAQQAAPDSESSPAPEPVPAPAPSPVAAAAPTPVAPSPPAQTQAEPIHVDGFVGIVGSVDFSPSPTMGVALGAEVRWRAVSFGLDGRVDYPASETVTNVGTISTYLAVASLAPCVHLGIVSGCALAQAGRMHAFADVTGSPHQDVLWLGVGGRLGLSIHVGSRFDVRLRADVVGDIHPPKLFLNGSRASSFPLVAEALGADLVVHFR